MIRSDITPLWPQRKPDFQRLRRVLLRQGEPDRVPFIELFADVEIVAAVLGESLIYPDPGDREQRETQLLQRLRFCQTLGYDSVWAIATVPFPERRVLTGRDTAILARPERQWVNEHEGAINSMADYERYPWPTLETVDYFDLEFVAKHLPEGMQIIAATAGILEWVMWLMGYEPFALALHDQPDLIEAMFERIGSLMASVHETMVDMPQVGAVFLGDDMGYRKGTLVRPKDLRHYVFPRQRRLVEIAHSRDLPFLLHACGNLRLVMNDLIDDVGIDAKHSYEDAIMPVTEAKTLYGDRIAILGGVDMDILTRGSEDDVRTTTRLVLEGCMPSGGYALGSGNTVANYIPVRNYLAMLDEGNKVGVYQ